MSNLNGRPVSAEYAPYYDHYISLVKGENSIAILETQQQEMYAFYESIPSKKWDFRYAEGKWSIREVLLHVIDTERVFAYRMLRASRNDQTSLPGFDENHYAPNSGADNRSVESLLEEYKAVREATLLLAKNCTAEQFSQHVVASNCTFTPRSLTFIIAGHEKHHQTIIKERYL